MISIKRWTLVYTLSISPYNSQTKGIAVNRAQLPFWRVSQGPKPNAVLGHFLANNTQPSLNEANTVFFNHNLSLLK